MRWVLFSRPRSSVGRSCATLSAAHPNVAAIGGRGRSPPVILRDPNGQREDDLLCLLGNLAQDPAPREPRNWATGGASTDTGPPSNPSQECPELAARHRAGAAHRASHRVTFRGHGNCWARDSTRGFVDWRKWAWETVLREMPNCGNEWIRERRSGFLVSGELTVCELNSVRQVRRPVHKSMARSYRKLDQKTKSTTVQYNPPTQYSTDEEVLAIQQNRRIQPYL